MPMLKVFNTRRAWGVVTEAWDEAIVSACLILASSRVGRRCILRKWHPSEVA
ncbi:hypothetical protein BDN71DRAFT_1097950 [Pleurotus eryngii]|uniref:Uncharacterized protein n=1 Tax=Pleurotus eryngii TaxID=5323 RepID=A0A9P6DF82_PLEER|nr:hypothetical protein BDN71DRAFT_1097950 [Pleurotus eryngii]